MMVNLVNRGIETNDARLGGYPTHLSTQLLSREIFIAYVMKENLPIR